MPSLADHLRALDAQVAALNEAGLESLTDTLAKWVSAQYAATARRTVDEAGRAGLSLPVLHSLAADILALRKGDQSAAWLDLEREWLKLGRKKTTEAMERQFEQWMKDPKVQKRRNQTCTLSEEEQAARIRKILGS